MQLSPGWTTNPERVYFIAEAGVNHNGEIEKAIALVDVAAAAGADAVKFQTFDTKALAAENAPKAAYQNRNDDRHANQFDMLKSLELSRDDWHKIYAHCAEQKGSPFCRRHLIWAARIFSKSSASPGSKCHQAI